MDIGFGLCYFTDKLHLPERRLELLPGESASQENLEKAMSLLTKLWGVLFLKNIFQQ